MRPLFAVLGWLVTVALATGCEADPPPAATSSQPPPSSSPHVDSKRLVTVPRIKPYVSIERAQSRLEEVGLVGVVEPEPLGPAYFVATRPEAGTRVALGSEVRLLTGDG